MNKLLVVTGVLACVLTGCHRSGPRGTDVFDLAVGTGDDEGGPLTDGGTTLGDSAVGGCTPGTINAECKTNADCDDNNPATVDTCQLSGGEFPTGTCLHSACDGGLSCVSQAVDPTCLSADMGDVYPPFVALHAPDVPASCDSGFQLGDASKTLMYTVKAKTAAGSQMLTLDLDIATYLESDGVAITGVDGNCKKYTLFDTCHLKTADQAEMSYTDGLHRPTDQAIRQYHLDLRPGTSQLTFDFTNVRSPMYVEVLGLCDFTLTTPPTALERWFALVN